MSDSSSLEATTLTHRVVLLGVAELSGRDAAPANAGEVVRTCLDNIDDVKGDVLGRLSEADVARALNELEDAGLVEDAEVGDTSAVGKGRPAYVLPMEIDAVCETFEDDARIESLVAHVKSVCT